MVTLRGDIEKLVLEAKTYPRLDPYIILYKDKTTGEYRRFNLVEELARDGCVSMLREIEEKSVGEVLVFREENLNFGNFELKFE